MRIIREESAGLIVDMQEKLMPHMAEEKTILENTRKLIKGLQILDIPVLVTQQYTKGLGETIQPIASIFENFEYFEKLAFSCCDDPSFDMAFRQLNKRFVILAGIESHVCILQTSIDLLEKGYVPVIVEDCITSRKLKDKEIALKRTRDEGAIITTSESVLFELLRYSKIEEFKKISKLVK
ncbi:MAG: hydrolase [Bacteroidales bacterium]